MDETNTVTVNDEAVPTEVAPSNEDVTTTPIQEVRIPIEYNGKVHYVTPEQAGALAKRSLDFAEQAKNAKEYQQQLNQLKQQMEDMNIVESLKAKGYTSAAIKEYLADIYGNILEEEQETPEQKELKNLKKYKEEQEKKSKTFQEQLKAQREAEAVEKHTNEIATELAKEIKSANLPNHPFFAKFAVQEMIAAQTQGQNLSVKEAVRLAEVHVADVLSSYLQSLPVDTIEKLIGSKVIKGINDNSVKQYKQGTTPKPTTPPPASTPTSSTTKKKVPMNEFFRNL